MSSKRAQRRPVLESLEDRQLLSSDTLAITPGVVQRPGEIARVSAPIAAQNLAARKHATIIRLNAHPGAESSLRPVVRTSQDPAGQPLPLRQGAPFIPGRHGSATAFTKVARPGPLTTGVTGSHGTTGSFNLQTSLPGDVNGDGVVNLADEQAFALAYMSHYGQPFYNPAADANGNGFVGHEDAKILLRNLTPLTPKVPLEVKLVLAPQDQVLGHVGVKNSGGITRRTGPVTILGKTTPGSIVFSDNSSGNYAFNHQAIPVDANGNFSFTGSQSKDLLTNFEFLVIDPYGQQKIAAFPLYRIGVAT